MRISVESLSHRSRFRQIFLGQDGIGFSLGDFLPREQERLREICAHEIEIMRYNENRALFFVPAPDERKEIRNGSGIDRCKRLVE
jgi:hypothetical protein